MTCQVSSATLTSSVTSDVAYSYLQYTTPNKITFDPFTCVPHACCGSLTYQVSTNEALVPNTSQNRLSTPILDTNTNSATYGKMVMDVYTGEMYNENFWIHYSNS
jgi:hypothetical protein